MWRIANDKIGERDLYFEAKGVQNKWIENNNDMFSRCFWVVWSRERDFLAFL